MVGLRLGMTDSTSSSSTPIVTRFAPSPTGHLHVGGARTALFCWAMARNLGGRFLLRVEDTDQKRSREEASRGILSDLAWLGIEWDEGPEWEGAGGDPRAVGPFFQSQRLEMYQAFFDQLIESGAAYPAFEGPDELAQLRAEAQSNKQTFRYTQRPDYNAAEALERAKTEPHVLRLRMPEEPIVVEDLVLGSITFTSEHFDDFVIRKVDGFPTYHFAVVIDDELMGVTHVLRGQEHLNNTPKHVGLMKLLKHQDGTAFRVPAFAHVPLIFSEGGSKMSKRDKDKAVKSAVRSAGMDAAGLAAMCGLDEGALAGWLKDKSAQLDLGGLEQLADGLGVELPEIEVDDFRKAGYLPEVLNNFLALLGWTPGVKNEDGTDRDRFGMAFLGEHFDASRIGKSNASFDRAKLLAFNAHTIQHELTDEQFSAGWRSWCEQYAPEIVEKLGDVWEIAARAAKPRAKTFRDAVEPLAFVSLDASAITFDEKAVRKNLLKGEPSGLSTLEAFRAEVLEPWSGAFGVQEIDAAVTAFCEAREIGMGKIAGPLRVAMTGTGVSPGLGETLALVGLTGVLERVARCLELHQPAAGE